MAAHLPPDSAVARSQDPDHLWTLPALLLATVVDELRVQTWLKTKDGARGRNRPKPIPRPGVQQDPGTKRLGNASMSLAEAKEWRKARRTGPA